ncbi:D8Ertd354e protein [Zea mays]|uniref:D8Ertd354e protein n=1 Tax=Zea mays TaxID=4577 RepID=A0A1D6JMJ4_MAIZE|nr:D8Ertd354e protein [Zea mays]
MASCRRRRLSGSRTWRCPRRASRRRRRARCCEPRRWRRRARIRESDAGAVPYADFLRLCCDAAGPDAGPSVARALDESGSVIVLEKTVFLRPDMVEQIWKVAGSEVCDCREEPLHEVQLQHRRCHGDEHGLQRSAGRFLLAIRYSDSMQYSRSNLFGMQYSRKRYFVLEDAALRCFKSAPSSKGELSYVSSTNQKYTRGNENVFDAFFCSATRCAGGFFHGVRSLSFGVDLQEIRLMGVLQRIAITYLLTALCEIWIRGDEDVDYGYDLLKRYRY